MLRAFLLSIVTLAAAGPALAAGDIDTCRNTSAEAAARFAACESVIADDKITGKSRAAAYGFRGETLRRQYEPALVDFAEARRLNPEGWQIPNYRCITYTEIGRFDEAIADCNEVLAKYPKWVGPITNRGNAYLAKGDFDAALRDYNEA